MDHFAFALNDSKLNEETSGVEVPKSVPWVNSTNDREVSVPSIGALNLK